MEDFINKLVGLMKGTAANMKRGLDGTAMEEMQQFERDRNAKLIDNAYPGGMPQYARDNGMMGTSTPTTTAPAAPKGNGYLETLRALLSKQ